MSTRRIKRQHWVILLALVLILQIAAIGFSIWRDKHLVENNQLDLNAAKALVMHRPGFADIALVRVDDIWQITAPCQIPANPQRLEPLMQALSSGSHQYSALEVDLDAAGLTEPAAMFMVDGTRIAIGAADNSGERRYIRRDNIVELIPEWVLSMINSGLSGIAELNLFSEELQRIEYADTGQALNNDQLPLWQGVSAQQVVQWPIEDMPEILASSSLQFQFANGSSTALDIILTEKYTAMHKPDSRCAFIVDLASVPASAYR